MQPGFLIEEADRAPLRPPAQRGDGRARGGRAQARRAEPRRHLPRHHAADAAPQRLRRHQPGDRLHLGRGRPLRAAARLRDRGRRGHPGRAQPGRRAEAAMPGFAEAQPVARPRAQLRSIDGNPTPASATGPRNSASSTANSPADAARPSRPRAAAADPAEGFQRREPIGQVRPRRRARLCGQRPLNSSFRTSACALVEPPAPCRGRASPLSATRLGMPCSARSAVRSDCSIRASAAAASAGLAW